MSRDEYHLGELRLAQTLDHPRRVMPSIKPQHRRVLDVGCGAGQTLIACGIPSDVEAVGVDVDESALRLGRRLAGNIDFLRAHGEQLPFKAESFDLVICRVALPYMRISAALLEMSRVLKQGGDLWATLHSPGRALKELLDAVVQKDPKYITMQLYALVNGSLFHLCGKEFHLPFRPGRWESFQTEGGIRRALERAGFHGVHFDRSRGTFLAEARRR